MSIDATVIFPNNGKGLIHFLDNGRVTVARARGMVAHEQ